ncbi:hypothetical protein MLD38_019759 [Melastoma candidum]|uniref:Uncharacterized protein n=1 Tax=Melastoma candidum TaxID=119954 RepID=A0ACB9R240_9MYRT|nr:hypothetical protein MLD38_019759 [Melastoma candidum]
MATQPQPFLSTNRYAVVTGGNKGIGLEICRQLAQKGVTVILTSRDEKRGLQALQDIENSGFSNVIFHRLDVSDVSTIPPLFDFVNKQFGRIDILVNNAGILGTAVDPDIMTRETQKVGGEFPFDEVHWKEISKDSYELAEECLRTNYYGAKAMIEAFLPLLQLSTSPRIVNVSSTLGTLQFIPGEWLKKTLNDPDTLTEEKVEEILKTFLEEFKAGNLREKGYPPHISAYKMAKASLNAYSRILAKKLPSVQVNCVCPGFVRSDIVAGNGLLSPTEGAESAVRLAVRSEEGPTGRFYFRMEVADF